MKVFVCLICGFLYSEEDGIPKEGIPKGTLWEDVPLDWLCPECGVNKFDFEMVEI
ncbi:rubredoxin [archaeon]|nr:rubredoxin [archaeon]